MEEFPALANDWHSPLTSTLTSVRDRLKARAVTAYVTGTRNDQLLLADHGVADAEVGKPLEEVEPRLLLLDEPFGAIDAKVRQRLRVDTKKLQRELKVPTILVTHDQREALELVDRCIAIFSSVHASLSRSYIAENNWPGSGTTLFTCQAAHQGRLASSNGGCGTKREPGPSYWYQCVSSRRTLCDYSS